MLNNGLGIYRMYKVRELKKELETPEPIAQPRTFSMDKYKKLIGDNKPSSDKKQQ
jgi:hypothetical protein